MNWTAYFAMSVDTDATAAAQHYIGGGADSSTIHPSVLVAMLVAIVLMWVLPRKYVILPFMAIIFLSPLGEQIDISGLHFFVIRFLILAGWMRMGWERIAQKKPILGKRFNKVDKLFLVWAMGHSIAVVLLWRSGAAVVNQFGVLWNVIGGYFLIRHLIHDRSDILRVVKALAVITTILGLAMLNEKLRMQNIFAFIGGVPLVPEMRDGHIRAQGPFMHPLLAGSFGATCVPLFIWLWYQGKAKALAVAAGLGGIAMAVTCACSTPLMAGLAGVAALFIWPVRSKLRMMLWSMVACLVLLQIVMKAPVWFLIARIDLAGGSSGYHRAKLIDTFLRHFWDWWLVGTKDAFSWGWDMWDTCNQYIQEGEGGGLIPLVCFILMIAYCFRRLGKAMRRVRWNSKQEWSLWILGCALLSHVVGFVGISYFDQTQMAWFILLAIVLAATSLAMAEPKPKPAALDPVLLHEPSALEKEWHGARPKGRVKAWME